MKIEMSRQDLIELYQLMKMYNRTYEPDHGDAILSDIMEHYYRNFHEDVETARNPRDAGRKKKYDAGKALEISRLRAEGKTIREIAEETGCSVGYVQGAIKKAIVH